MFVSVLHREGTRQGVQRGKDGGKQAEKHGSQEGGGEGVKDGRGWKEVGEGKAGQGSEGGRGGAEEEEPSGWTFSFGGIALGSMQAEAGVGKDKPGELGFDEEKERKLLEAQFDIVYPEYKKLPCNIHWNEYMPAQQMAELGGSRNLDVLEDLVDADMLAIFRKVVDKEKQQVESGTQKLYCLLPAVASCKLGALNAEAFCERVISCANNVVSKLHLHLGASKIASIVFLWMNRGFMEYVWKRWGHEIEQELAERRRKER